jgi:hypothetical protein
VTHSAARAASRAPVANMVYEILRSHPPLQIAAAGQARLKKAPQTDGLE